MWAGGKGNERGRTGREHRFPQGGDSLGGRRRWEGSQAGIKVHAGEVPLSSSSFYSSKASLLDRARAEKDEGGAAAPRLLWLGRGGCPQCRGSGVTRPGPNTHWHKPSVRPSPQPSSCPCYPHLSQAPPLSSRSISEQQEAVPPALGSPAPRREREGAPPPPPPGTGKRVFNGTPQRMAALGSHLVISPAARRQSSAHARSAGNAPAPVQTPPGPPSETPA